MIGEDSGITFGLASAIGLGVLGLWWRIEAKFNSERIDRETLARDFANYKLDAERRFVSSTVLEKTEERLISSMEKLAVRVETLISRMEAIGVELAKLSNKGD